MEKKNKNDQDGAATEAHRHKHTVERAVDKRALLQKHARQKSASLLGARQKNAGQLGLVGLLHFIIHFRHVNFLLYEYRIP